MRIVYFASGILAATVVVVACGTDLPVVAIDGPDNGGDSGLPDSATDAGTPTVETFRVGGTVAGLLGTGLVLQLNGIDTLSVAANGSFAFPTKLAKGAAYNVSIKTQPTAPSQTCVVATGSGTMGGGDMTAITVNCSSDRFTVGGTVSGLVGTGLVLQNNGGDDVIVNGAGGFTFPTPIASGAQYAVTVKTQPDTPSQTCLVTAGSGAMAAAAVTTVSVVCATNKYKVGGTVAGLVGTGLELQLNGAQPTPIAGNGPFQFPDAIISGASYEVTVLGQPASPAQTCIVAGGSGTIGGGEVSSVTVNCTTNAYTIGGTTSGLLGTAVLQNNGGDDLIVNTNGTFAFATPIENGATYAVTVKDQPGVPSQTCAIGNGTGTVGTAAVKDVTLTCVTNTFKVKATVSGLDGSGLVIQNNLGDDVAVGADGTIEFATAIKSGQTFDVTVKTQPLTPSQTCTVTGGTGTMGGADVTATILCSTQSFTVGGAVTGLTGAGVVLQNNGGDDLTINSDDTFTFPTPVASGATYAVTVKTHPAGKACAVTNGSGTIANGPVSTVKIECRDCGGYAALNGCWYVAPSLGMTCPQVCASHGGFDSAGSQHEGNPICTHFYPTKNNGSNWVSVECCSTDNNTNWGANGETPDPNFSHGACYLPCSCMQ